MFPRISCRSCSPDEAQRDPGPWLPRSHKASWIPLPLHPGYGLLLGHGGVRVCSPDEAQRNPGPGSPRQKDTQLRENPG